MKQSIQSAALAGEGWKNSLTEGCLTIAALFFSTEQTLSIKWDSYWAKYGILSVTAVTIASTAISDTASVTAVWSKNKHETLGMWGII